MYEERLQHHDIEAEEAVVGSLLIDGESILKVIPLIKPRDFYRERNAFCFEACMALFERREAINQVTVTSQLNLQNRLEAVGGAAYLSHLVSIVPTSLHAEHYANIVGRCATMRRLIAAASDIADIGYRDDPDVNVALSAAEDALFSIRQGSQTRDFVPLADSLLPYLEESSPLDLVDGEIAILRGLVQNEVRVEHGDDALHLGQALDRRVQEGLGHRQRLGDTAGFDYDVLRGWLSVEKPHDLGHEIVPHDAAHAAIGKADGLALNGHDQLGVDVDLAEVVDQDGDALARRVREYVVEQRGLARPEKAADHGHRHRPELFADSVR